MRTEADNRLEAMQEPIASREHTGPQGRMAGGDTEADNRLEAMQERIASREHTGPQGRMAGGDDDERKLRARHQLAFHNPQQATANPGDPPRPDEAPPVVPLDAQDIVDRATKILNDTLDEISATTPDFIVSSAPPPPDAPDVDFQRVMNEFDRTQLFPEFNDPVEVREPDIELPGFVFTIHGKIYYATSDVTPTWTSDQKSAGTLCVKVKLTDGTVTVSTSSMSSDEDEEVYRIKVNGIQIQNSDIHVIPY
jgi:hypothetical protein